MIPPMVMSGRIVGALFVVCMVVAAACSTVNDGRAPSDEPSVPSPGVREATAVEGVSGPLRLEPFASLDEPVDATSRTGDDGVFVVSRGGTVVRFAPDGSGATVVLDVSDLTEAGGERGLLGLAFSPEGGEAYIVYTDADGDVVVASLTVDARGDLQRPTLRSLLVIPQPYSNHNGGDVVVEPSGDVLIATGDGGSRGDPERVALDDSSLLGKVLRVDPSTGSVRLLARGLRNPWRIDLHDDRLWLADVGQNEWEEISVLDGVGATTGVVDFGWSAWEANERYNDDQSSPAHVPPILAYRHGDDGCSVSGGAVATSGSLAGSYVFADYCSGRVWSMPAEASGPDKTLLFEGVDSPVAIVRAHDQLYVLSLSGDIWQVTG